MRAFFTWHNDSLNPVKRREPIVEFIKLMRYINIG